MDINPFVGFVLSDTLYKLYKELYELELKINGYIKLASWYNIDNLEYMRKMCMNLQLAGKLSDDIKKIKNNKVINI